MGGCVWMSDVHLFREFGYFNQDQRKDVENISLMNFYAGLLYTDMTVRHIFYFFFLFFIYCDFYFDLEIVNLTIHTLKRKKVRFFYT